MKKVFKIPDLPESINSLYKINYHTKQVYMSNAGRAYKMKVKMYMPSFKAKETKYSIRMDFNGHWLYKNGKNKRADIQNLTKVLIDAVFERIGVDDSYIYKLEAYKIQNNSQYTLVTLETI